MLRKLLRSTAGRLPGWGACSVLGAERCFPCRLINAWRWFWFPLFFVAAFYLGHKYRRCVDELIKKISLFKLIGIFAPTWRFLLMTTILMGVGIGLTEWSFFAENKQLLLSVILPTAFFDAINILKDFFAGN
jgi:hypothetical protein